MGDGMVVRMPGRGVDRALGLLASAALLGSALVVPAPARATAPGANGKIVYSQSPAFGWPGVLFVADADGTNQVQLTSGTIGYGDNAAAWSPGGTLIAFDRAQTSDTNDPDAPSDIWTIAANGSGLKRLTNTAANELNPTFSPDGARIAFESNRAGNYEIYSMKIDGSDVRRLTNNAADDGSASWSPDRTKIAFHTNRYGNYEIATMNADGTGVTRLTSNAAIDAFPSWSPDGTKIVFVSTRSGGDFDLVTMAANGSGQTVILDTAEDEVNSVWAPDGTRILYDSDLYGDYDIFSVAPDGTDVLDVILDGTDDWNPDWQPIPAFPLVDARFSTFKADIEWVFGEGITVGCSAERYCPDDFVTRGQMASFLARAMNLPPTATDYFSDDNGTTHEANINRIAAAGITLGCAPGLYCPNELVSRGQMASFLARALALPNTATDYFTDDNGTTHENNINRLAAAGITKGYTPTTYCPNANVTRGQMAAFLHRAFGP